MATFKHPGDSIKLLLHSSAVPELLSASKRQKAVLFLNHKLQIFENHFYSLLLSWLCSQCQYAVHVPGITSGRGNCSENKAW